MDATDRRHIIGLAATLQVAIDVALGETNIWEENMKARVVTLTAAIAAGGTGAA